MITIQDLAFGSTEIFIEKLNQRDFLGLSNHFSISQAVYNEILETIESYENNTNFHISKEAFEFFKDKPGDYRMEAEIFNESGKTDLTVHLEMRNIKNMMTPFFRLIETM